MKSGVLSIRTRAAVLVAVLVSAAPAFAQSAPPSANRPWLPPSDFVVSADARHPGDSRFSIDPERTYSLAELIDLAQAHNPETRFAWERARAQAAALGVARSELYPTLAAAAATWGAHDAILFNDAFIDQTEQAFGATFDLSYTVFDFGARAGRIEGARADVVAANFAFNDTHRRVIYQVAQAYYQLLNASGQEDAARANLSNAEAVQRAAEARLQQGLATLPDVLEAKSATAQARYDLQSVRGDVEVAQGDLTTALGARPTTTIRVQPLDELSTPETIGHTVDATIDRALGQRPDLMQQVAGVRSAYANVKEARAAYYPALTISARPSPQVLYGWQPPFPRAQAKGVFGEFMASLNWTVFDGGARKNNVAQAEATARSAEAEVASTRDRIANEVWTAYSRFNTALRQREAAVALLQAADQSYAAALESYNLGLRSLLDVTAAQRTLAQARAADVLARTQVLTALANLAFRTGSAVNPTGWTVKPRP
jgi:outer membrane protein